MGQGAWNQRMELELKNELDSENIGKFVIERAKNNLGSQEQQDQGGPFEQNF